MDNTIRLKELNILYSDLLYLYFNRLNVYREFINTLDLYETFILTAFLMYFGQECSSTLLSIYRKFSEFKERKCL